MKRHPNLRQKHLCIPPRQRSTGRVSNFGEELAREEARFRVEARVDVVVVFRLEVELFLLGELEREVRDDGCADRARRSNSARTTYEEGGARAGREEVSGRKTHRPSYAAQSH